MTDISTSFDIFKARQATIEFLYKKGGVVFDLSTYKITFSAIKDKYGSSPAFTRKNAAAGGGDTEIKFVTDGTDGKFYVYITATNTTTLDAGAYMWQIDIQSGANDPICIGQNKLFIKETF